MKKHSGLTLIELIITIGIFLIAVLGILGLFSYSFKIVGASKSRLTAIGLATKQMEIIRNMPYEQIGTTGGWPHGDLPSSQTINKNGIAYILNTIVEFVDDPFDHTFPLDTTPADYKRIEIRISWDKFPCAAPVKLTTLLSPKGLEFSGDYGGIRVHVLDFNGQAVPQAIVHIKNTTVVPNIDFTQETNNSGVVEVLNLPPASETYEITATKNGYTQDATYSQTVENPSPLPTHLKVLKGELEEITFTIDRVSTLNISSLTKNCGVIPNISFTITGLKLIGRDPDVYKYSKTFSTGPSGKITINDLEFDTYTLTINAPSYDLNGTKPLSPLTVTPNTEQNFNFILSSHQNNTLLVVVKDNSTGLVLSGANVKLSKTGYEQTLITGKGIWRQTDWQGGVGQEDWSEENKYFSDDGNINNRDIGEIKLEGGPTHQSFNEYFDNTTYKDSATTADWDAILGELKLNKSGGDFVSPGIGQSLEVDNTSFIITKAYLNPTQTLNGQTINYYLSANGGSNWENVVPGIEHTFNFPGSSLKWKAELLSNDPQVTPSIQGLSISYTYIDPYRNSGYLISSTFDSWTNQTVWGNIGWEPQNQDPALGLNPVKIQVATSDDKQTWNFKGPDGTEGSYYTTPATAINPIHNDQRYMRYKIFFSTENSALTPLASDVTCDFTSGCSTPGQVFFSPLQSSAYDLEIALDGYQTINQSVNVSGNNSIEIYLNPNL